VNNYFCKRKYHNKDREWGKIFLIDYCYQIVHIMVDRTTIKKLN
jgi:hypothetical protein